MKNDYHRKKLQEIVDTGTATAENIIAEAQKIVDTYTIEEN